MWFWAIGWFKGYAWTRRSLHFAGMVPHFGTAHQGGLRQLFALEYIPPKRDLWTPRNMLLFFSGAYRVWEFRAVRVKRFRTAGAAQDWMRERSNR
ncbi:hypothetical protein J5J83_19705 [Azoarcus sp. L1K30]|uniref:hypothetical protein n=1 Tax=Azoarcus sp. L1K30 TaxID=2820277 RepID=UPI001B823B87|nr:hypothetical protein [Azoarcus sp. L1K30]MBR0568353.1 hypothetical protein [Azoarcus sp. L1K30]